MKLKRKLITIVLLLLTVFIAYEIFLFSRFEGNMIIHVSNYTYSSDNNLPISYDLYIDDQFYHSSTIECCGFEAHSVTSLATFPGKKTIKVILEDGTEGKISTQNYLVNFLVFEIYNQTQRINQKETMKYEIITGKRLNPVILE